VLRHENTSTAGSCWAIVPQALDLAVRIDLVVLKDGHLDLLALVLDLLGGGVGLLFPLLSTTTETKDEMEGGFFLDVVVGQRSTILELLASEDQALLVGRDPFLVLNLRLDIVDRIGRLDFKCDSFTREGFYEDLHLALAKRPEWNALVCPTSVAPGVVDKDVSFGEACGCVVW